MKNIIKLLNGLEKKKKWLKTIKVYCRILANQHAISSLSPSNQWESN